MDPTLVTGALSILGALASGIGTGAAYLIKRHVLTLDVMAANDTKNSESISRLANEMTRTREVQERQETRIASLEQTIDDKRNSEMLAASNESNTLMKAALGNITGKFAAINAERAKIDLPDLEVTPPDGIRAPASSRH